MNHMIIFQTHSVFITLSIGIKQLKIGVIYRVHFSLLMLGVNMCVEHTETMRHSISCSCNLHQKHSNSKALKHLADEGVENIKFFSLQNQKKTDDNNNNNDN